MQRTQVPPVTAQPGSCSAQTAKNNSGSSSVDWNSERLRRCLPRVITPPVLGLQHQVNAQHPFNSRAVSQTEYSQPPYNSVGKLAFTGVNWQTCQGILDYAGTAWLIAPRVIMTVAHNLFEVKCKDRSSNVEFFPGFDGQPQESYRVIDFEYVKAYEGNPPSVPADPSAVNDVGIGILDRDASSALGKIPPLTNGVVDFDKVMAIGYPGNHDLGAKMWRCEGRVVPELSKPDQFVMPSDFQGGSSGGPWVVETPQGWRAVGAQVGNPYGVAGNYCVSGVFGQQVKTLLDWANSRVDSGVEPDTTPSDTQPSENDMRLRLKRIKNRLDEAIQLT